MNPLALTEPQVDTHICTPGDVMNGHDDFWSNQCYLEEDCTIGGNPCQANDVVLVGAYVADAFGDPFPICQAGEPVQAFLWAKFNNSTGTSRYAVRAYTEVYLDGTYSSYLNSCAFDELPPGDAPYVLLGPISFTCGQQFELHNTWITWDTSQSVCSDSTNPKYDATCGDYPNSKCSSEAEITLLSTNFYYECEDLGETYMEICFTNLTTGGIPPYTTLWNFGDGNTSTELSPCHVYNTTSGVYEVVLTVTDSEGVDAGAVLEIDQDNLICPLPALELDKIADRLAFSSVGEVVTYTITATNSGNTYLTNVIVNDPLLAPSTVTCDVLAPGEACVLKGDYTIAQSDLDACIVSNTATSSALDPKGNILTPEPVSMSLLSEECNAELTLTKVADQKTCLKIGDTVTYTVTATNSGTVTLYDVIVSDPLLIPQTETCATLAPGQSCVLTGTYMITASDALAGVFENTAEVTAKDGDAAPVSTRTSTTVTVCDDNNICTTDNCDPLTGFCEYVPVDCNDQNACTNDSCDPATGCVHTPVNCNDQDACTTDTCDPAAGCVYTPVDCDD